MGKGKRSSSSSPAAKAAAAAVVSEGGVSGESRNKSRSQTTKDVETPTKENVTTTVHPPNQGKQPAFDSTDHVASTKKKEPTTTDAMDTTAAASPPKEVNDDNNSKTIQKQKQDKATTTKRQKRKQLQQSDKNKWPQHPHIKTAEAREQAYLRVAGLAKTSSSSKKKKNAQPLVDTLTNADMVAELRWGRCLASTEARTRHAAVQQLQHYLEAKCHPETGGGISELDLLKLCKALWYTLYLADHAVVQQELSQRLAQLLWCLAGTPEEDEYAGQAYLEMLEEEEEGLEQDEGDDDDDDVIMQVIHGDVGDEDEDDDEEEEEDDDDMDDDDALQIVEMDGDDDDDDDDDEDDGEEEVDDEEEDDENDQEDDDDVDDSEIPHCRGAHLASLFVRTLFRTIRREWGNMDKYRIDKFYTLMRLVLEQMFTYMAQRHWNLGIIRLFNDTLVDEILTQTPNGLRNHLIDITLEELAKVNADAAKAPIPLTEATFFDCLEPYLFLAQTGGSSGGRRRAVGRDDHIQARVLDRILVKFLNDYSVVSDNYDPHHECHHHDHDEGQGQPSAPARIPDDDKEQRHHLVFDQVHVGSIAKALFDMASDGTITLSCYRKSLYEMHKTYMKRVTLVGRDVALDNMEGDDEEDDEDEEGGDDDDQDDDDDDGMNGRGAKKPKWVDDDEEEDDTKARKVDNKAEKKKSNKTKDASKKRGTDSNKEEHATAASAAADDDDEMPESAKTTKSSNKKKEKKRKRELEAAAAAAEEEKKSKVEPGTRDKAKAKKVTDDTPAANDDSEPKQSSSSEKKKKDKKQKKLKQEADNKANDDAPTPEPSNKKKKTGKEKHGDGIEEASVKAKELKPLQKQIEKAIKAMSPTLVEDVKDKQTTPESPIAPGSDESTKKKRKRNKRKGKQEGTDDSAVAAPAAQEDVEVTISVADQKKAARAAAVEAAGNATSKSTETPPAKTPAGSKQTKSSEKAKHVSFGKHLSKSYVSSITALRTMDPPPLVKKSPEEGILLNKDADPVVRRELLGKNLGTEDRRNSQKNNRPRQMQYTKSVWTAPMTMTRKSPFRKNTGGGAKVQRNLPNQKRRKASDYF